MSVAIRLLMATTLGLASQVIGRSAWAGDANEAKPGAAISLPATAAGAIREAFPGSTVRKVREDRENGLRLFVATVGDAGGEREVRVSSDGVIVTVKRNVKVADLPVALVKAIQAATAGELVSEMETRAEIAVAGNGTRVWNKLARPKITYGPPEGVEIDRDGRVWPYPASLRKQVLRHKEPRERSPRKTLSAVFKNSSHVTA